MKPRKTLLSGLAITVCLSLAPAIAATYQWDQNSTAAGLGGTGTWNTTNTFWDLVATGVDDGTDTTVAYTFTSADTAIFGGTAGTVTFGAANTVGTVTLNTAGYVFDTGANNATWSKLGASANGFTKTGSGVLTIGTASVGTDTNASYSGNITIAGGELKASANTASGAKSILGSGTLTLQATTGNTATLRFFTGSTGNAQSYANNLVLNSTNGAATLISDDGVLTYSGTVSLTGTNNTINARYSGKNATFSNVISGTGALTISSDSGNTGTTFLTGGNTYSGNTSVSGGSAILEIGGSGRLGSTGASTGAYAGSISTGSNNTFRYNSSATQTLSGTITNAGTLTQSAGNLTLSGTVSGAGAITLTGGTLALDYTTNNTSKLSTGALTLSGGTLALTGNAGADTTQSVASLNLTGASSITLATQAGRTLTFDNSAGTLARTAVVNLATTGSGTGVFKFAGTTANSALGWATWNNGLAFAKTDSLNQVTAAGQSTLNASASDLSTWTTGATQYATTGAAFTNSVGAGVTIDGVTFQDAAARTVTIGTGNTLTLNGGVIVASGVGANTSTITGGTIRGAASGVLSLVNNASGSLTIASAIANNGGATGLVKYGSGTVIISGDSNAFSGPVTVTAGELQALVTTAGGAKSTLGSGAITANTGTNLRFKTGSTGAAMSFANAINLNGANLYHEDGVMTFSGALTSTGTSSLNGVWGDKPATYANVNVASGTLVQAGNSSDTFSALTIASGATFRVDNGATTTIGTIAGAGSFTLNSGGNLTITGDNSASGYSGNVSLTNSASGTFTVNSGAKFVTTGTFNEGYAKTNTINGVLTTGVMTMSVGNTAVTLGGTGTVNVSGFTNSNSSATTISVANFNVGSGGITLTNGSITLGATTVGALAPWSSSGALRLTAGTTTTFDTTGGAITLSGAIGNSTTGALTKTGTGMLTLSGNNTYTGATAVSAGTLRLSGTNASAITVNSGGTLSVGSVGNTSQSLTLNAGSTLAVDASTTNAFTSNGVNFAGATSLLFNSALTSGSTYYVLNYGAGGVTNFANLAVNARGTLTNDTGNSRITFTTGTVGTRTWNTTNGVWDNMTTANFVEGDQLFSVGDTVVFNDPASASVVTLTGQLTPASVSVTNTNDYTFSGTGFLAGSSTLTKSGTGTLTITTANTYTGNTTITGGTLEIGGSGQLGSGTYAGTISNTGTLKINTTANQTLSGVISGTGALVKDNTGTLTLSATPAYTGTTTISGGILSLTGGNGTFGNGSGYSGTTPGGMITINNGATLAIAANNTRYDFYGQTFAFGATGGGSITTGTAINWVNRGGWTFTTSGGAKNTISGNSGINANGNTVTFDIARGTDANADLDVLLAIGNTNSTITKSGTGILRLQGVNTYSGATSITGGTLEIAGAGQLNSGAYASAITIASGATFRYASSAAQTLTGTIGGGGTLDIASGSTLTWNGSNTSSALTIAGGGILRTTTTQSWTGGGSAVTFAMTGGEIRVEGGTLSVASNANEVWTNNKSSLYVASGATFNGNEASATAVGGIFVDKLTGSGTIRIGYATGYANKLTFGINNGSGTFDGVLADNAAGFGNYTKAGSGTQTLTGVNTYTGATAITGGTLEIAGAGQFNSGTYGNTIAIASGSTFKVNSTAAQTLSGVISGAGALVKDNTGTLALSAQNTFTGGTTVNAGVLDLTGGGGENGTIRGTVTVNTGAILRLSAGDVTGYSTSGQLSAINLVGGTLNVNTTSNQTLGNAVITMTGGAITGMAGSNLDFFQTSSAINTLASATTSTISGTKLSIRQTAGLTITVADGAAATDLQVDSAIASNGYYTSAPLVKSGTGKLSLSGNNTYSGATNVNAGVLNIQHGNALGGTGSGTTVADGAALEMQGGISVGNEALGVSGTGVSNGGALRNISGNNTYGGQITLNANTRINSDAGTLTLDGSIIHGTGHNLTVGGSGDTVINGFITTTSGSLTKDGSGTLTLTQTNAFVGDTTISGGSLALSGSGSVASTNIINNGNFNVSAVTGGYTLGSTQTLTGNGTVTGAITIAGTLAIGASPGTMTFEDDLGLDAGSISNFEINGFGLAEFDLAQAAGVGTQTVTFGGTLNLLFSTGFNTNGSIKIFDFDGYSGGFTTVNTSGLASGYTASFDSTTGIVSVVPEASTTLLFGLGTLGLALRRRRAS